MNIIRQCPDTAWEFYRVGDDIAGAVPADLPAIIDHDILIPRLLHTRRHHRICNLPDHFFIDAIAGEFIPAVPAHRWLVRKLIEFLSPYWPVTKKGDAKKH